MTETWKFGLTISSDGMVEATSDVDGAHAHHGPAHIGTIEGMRLVVTLLYFLPQVEDLRRILRAKDGA